jgi:hypothetical protein
MFIVDVLSDVLSRGARSDLAEGEHVRFDSSLEERDLQGALVDVDSARLTRRVSVEANPNRMGSLPSAGPRDQIDVACAEA